MRVLFIRPKCGFNAMTIPWPPLGLLALASFAQSHGHAVQIFDHMFDRNLDETIAHFKPDAVAVTLISASSIPDAMQISRKLKALGLPVFWGGHMASAIPEEAARSGCADYIGISEGEYTLLELLDVVQGKRLPETVTGIAYVDENGNYRRTEDRPFANLSDFPPLDYSLIPMKRFLPENMYSRSDRIFPMITSKGCPCNCTFCFNKDFHRSRRRVYPIQTVLEQIKVLTEQYGVNDLQFVDEAVGVDTQELRTFCDGLKGLDLDLRWFALASIGSLTRDELKLMRDAGCRALQFGLETGSAEMRKRLHKFYDASKIEETLRNCRELGIRFRAFFIIGLPDETPAQLRETVRLYFRLQPDLAQVSYYTPIPGSELYQELVTSGKLIPEMNLESMEGSAMEMQRLTKNFSCIPNKDLLVVMNFIHWQDIFGKRHESGNRNFFLVIKYAIAHLRASLRAEGLRGFFCTTWESAKLFCSVAWYAHAYPAIRKKYDLYARNFGRTDWEK